MKRNNKGFSLVFIMLLVFFVSTLGFIVLEKKMIFSNFVNIVNKNLENGYVLENKYLQILANYESNSILTQKQISYNIPTDNDFHNIFYINSDILKFLTNSNYKLDDSVKIIPSGNCYLELKNSNDIELKIIELVEGTSKNILVENSKITINTSTGGFLNESLNFISGTGTYYQFDLNSPVAIFVRNTDESLNEIQSYINLKLNFYEYDSGSGVFINPITILGGNLKGIIYNVFSNNDKYFLKTFNF